MIYIREAHPRDGWWLGGGLTGLLLKLARSKAATDICDPATATERRDVAARCATTLQYGIPTLVDEMDDRVSVAYAARPTRLYLIDPEGRVAYAGGLGPYGFSPAALGRAIEALLARLDEKQLRTVDTTAEPVRRRR